MQSYSTVDVFRVEQLPVGDIGELRFEGACFLDILHLVLDKGAIGIALAMDQNQDPVALFPSVFTREPAGRLRHEDHEAEKENGRQHLNTPARVRVS